ncbi:DUF3606 domain-containing protein [Brevundimonas sp. S30B]|uniref:DUF3606 domain-containing protein n=1 Tax=unclassified Brevundimonas TaxID=2622653 RepID=UPI0010719141|nr:MULTISPECIES: DUF3606 domain-containing protein [unclassified Brevundimonas]QBX38100.1 DUF3606 domain-containing protein [Brevundimonas sp. MF30-B]TFW02546.1 DUF3606 domain-containing protein [Brevundimonas sp. S30B]
MSDDTSDRGPQDRSRISLTQDHEVRYWTQAIDATVRELQEAVQAVGPGAEAVRGRLKARRS